VPPAPLETLAAALGADVTRIEREIRLELRAALAEHELRVRALEQQIAEQAARLAAIPPPPPGQDGAPGADGAAGPPGPPGEPGLAGRDGADGRSLAFRGVWKGDKVYGCLDVVAFNGGSWVALQDAPGACPGDGWQLMACQGKIGKQGPAGEQGERGYPGPPAPAPKALAVDDAGILTLTLADGSTLVADFYPLLIRHA